VREGWVREARVLKSQQRTRRKLKMGLKSLRFCSVWSLSVWLTGCTIQTPAPIGIAVSPQSATITPGQTIQFAATVTDTLTGIASPGTTENNATGVLWSATAGTIDASGHYTAPKGAQSQTVVVTARSEVDPSKAGNATLHVVAPGKVSPTANVQVALYSISTVAAGNVSVQFGLDTNYGLTTWMQPSPEGGVANLVVAGMKASTPYHMRAVVQFSDGTQFTDTDHLFTTGAVDPAQAPTIITTTTPGMTPESGVELLALVSGNARPTIADLSGNVLWTYNAVPNGSEPNPIKLLPNGHFLINFSDADLDGLNSVIQEVDLTGALIWQMTASDLNRALAGATCPGCNITVVGTHHDFVLLPNGHLIVIAATQEDLAGTTVTGDVIIDLDQNHMPVWLWNEFDHLDVNRQPMGFPDWTHTNAVLYSPDDGNLIVSIRHQNWLIKVDYANGTGAGDILWKLGYQGDFALVGGTDPIDWFYAQHGPTFATLNTTGQFSLVLFDNGDDRVFPSGVICGTTGAPPCLYSTVPLLELDETAKTATLDGMRRSIPDHGWR
jgi:arylsulfate sulfotransferase